MSPEVVMKIGVKRNENEPETKTIQRTCKKVTNMQILSMYLPSATTIDEYKSLLAAQEEADAGMALNSLSGTDIKCTLHYDTTSRNNIDGDWVSIILKFFR